MRNSVIVLTVSAFLLSDPVQAQVTPDLNRNGMTDLADVQLFANQFGLTGDPLTIPSDLDLNGLVHIDDYLLFQPHVRGPTRDPCDPSLCYDMDPCTVDICVLGNCENIPIPECCWLDFQCIDDDVCTADMCLAFRCINPPVQCDPPNCEDGIACTSGVCLCGVCGQFEIDLNCDDGVACTRDECIEGLGCTHTPDDSLCPNQDDSDADCLRDRCNMELGCVVDSIEPQGSACDDEVHCTMTDVCSDNGNCTYTSQIASDLFCNGAPRENDPDDDCIFIQCDKYNPASDADGCATGFSFESDGSPCLGCPSGDCCCHYGGCDGYNLQSNSCNR